MNFCAIAKYFMIYYVIQIMKKDFRNTDFPGFIWVSLLTRPSLIPFFNNNETSTTIHKQT